jgi:transketolase
MSRTSLKHLTDSTHLVRKKIIEMAYQAGKIGSHVGGSLSVVEILVALYMEVMNINKDTLNCESRDRFILSKGHAAMCLYAVLELAGILSKDDIASFKRDGSLFHTHPCINPEKGIEFSSGSLGQGLSIAVGVALALKLKNNNASKVYVLLGDGECDEGSVWEAAMSAAHYKLDNIMAVVDVNGLQLDGFTKDVMSLGDMAEKFRSFGWETIAVNGHSIENLISALSAKRIGKPLAILAETIKGKGITFMENEPAWHHNRLSNSQYQQALLEVNGI